MDQDLNLNVKVGTSEAIKSLDNLKSAAEQAAESVGKIGQKAEETAGKVDKVGDAADKSLPKIQGLGSAFESVFSNALQGASQLGGNIGAISNSVSKAIPIVKQLNSTALKGLSGIKAGLASLGIGAIITAIGLLVSKLVEYAKKTREAQRAQRDLNEEIRKGASGAAEQVVALEDLARKYRQLGDDAKAKQQFLKDYREEIEKTGIAVNDVNTADDVFLNNTEKYKQALLDRAKATAAYQLAIQKTKEYLEQVATLEGEVQQAEEDLQSATSKVQGSWAANVRMYAEQGLKDTKERVEKELKDLEKTYNDAMNRLLGIYSSYTAKTEGILGGGTGGSNRSGGNGGSGGGGPKKGESAYEKWAKDNLLAVIEGELAVKRWEELLKREVQLRQEMARLRNQPVEEEEVEEESPKEYLTRLQERRRAAFENQKELLDIEVLSAKEKNNALYDLEMDRLDSESIYLQQMRDLTLEDTEEREELDRKIEENEQQKEIVRKKRLEQHKKDVAEEIQMYAQAAQAIGEIFGTVAQAEEERIQRQYENGEISEEQAKEQFETNKKWQYAQTWINTLAGMTAALTSPVMQSMGIPGWIAAAAQAASLLASGIAQTIKIKNTHFGDTGGSGGGGVSAPNVGVTPIDVRDDIQQSPSVLADSQSPRDQRVYILEGDIQDSNKRVEIREDNSTF